MQTRTAKFVSALFAGVLAGTSLSAAPENEAKDTEAKTADTCLSGPKGAVPPGSHWYYRVDRATKRNCWYLGEEKDKSARKAPEEDSSAAADPAPAPPKKPAPPRPIADARAELPLRQTAIEQDTRMPTAQRSPAPAAVASPPPDNSQRNGAGDTNMLSTVVASRWPESLGISSSAIPRPAPANRVAEVRATPEPPPTPPLAAAAVPLAAADASTGKSAGSIPMLLIVIAGALAAAGVGSAIVSSGVPRPAGRREVRRDRRTIWDSVRSPRLSPTAPMPDIDIPYEPRAADGPDRRIEQMLAKLAKNATAESLAASVR